MCKYSNNNKCLSVYVKSAICNYKKKKKNVLIKNNCFFGCLKLFLKRFLLCLIKLILLFQTPQLLGMMSITPDHKNASPDLKHKRKAKFESNVLVWLAISPTGMTRPLIKQSGYSVNKNIKKIQNILIPFMREHPDDVFWADLALALYQKRYLVYKGKWEAKNVQK